MYRKNDRAFFIYGFSKKDRDNIEKDEEKEFKKLAKQTFALSNEQLEKLIKNGTYEEVVCDEKNKSSGKSKEDGKTKNARKKV